MICWALQTTREYTLKIAIAHRLGARSQSALRCLVTASNVVASSASESNSSCCRWLGTFSCSSRVKFEVMLRPTDSRPVWLGAGHPSGAHNQIYTTVGHMRVCWCEAPSLTRGYICNLLLQLLLDLARAVTLVCKPHDINWPPHLRFPKLGGPGPRIYIARGAEWPIYIPGHWVLFLSPLTTHKMELF
jgi:hypothetical protein